MAMRIYPDGELQGRYATYSMVAKSRLFNSLDPSPFWDRDLDRSAAELIEDEFRDQQSAGVADLWLVPFYRKRRLFARLAGTRVSVRVSARAEHKN